MTPTIWDLEIRMTVPFDTMIYYPDDYVDEYIEEPSFKKIREFLKVQINIPIIIEDLYEHRGKNSSISIFYSDITYKNYILLDTDIDPSDQLDLITICIRCSSEYGGELRKYAHEFYTNRCKFNITYSEGNFEVIKLYNIDFSLFNQVSNNGYIGVTKNRKLNFYQQGNLLKSINT